MKDVANRLLGPMGFLISLNGVIFSAPKSTHLIELIELLIAKGAEVKAKTSNGCTPLHYLCENYDSDNLMEVVRDVERKGAKIDSKVKKVFWNKDVLVPTTCRLS